MSSLGSKAACWSTILEDAARQGYPVEDLATKAQEIHGKALRLAALHNGEKIYSVELQYEQVRSQDEKEALLEAFRGHGDLTEKRVEVTEDPARGVSVSELSATDPTEVDL